MTEPMTNTDREILGRQIKRAAKLEYLSCRVGGDRHRWTQCQPDFKPEYPNAKAVVHQCGVCMTIKRQVITKMGERLAKPDYEYPAEYQYKRHEGDSTMERMFTAQAVRAAMLSRVDEGALPSIIQFGVPE